MNNVTLNLYDLIRIEGVLPQPLLTPLLERFGRFRAERSTAPWRIELGTLDTPGYRPRLKPQWQFDQLGAHWLGQTQKRLVIQPISDGFRLLVRAPHYGRLHFGLLWAIRILMARQGGALMHGAVLGQGPRTLMLFGAKQVGKTQLVLGLMEEGWQLLAEDKFLFLQGEAYCLQDHFYLRPHHLRSHPWLPGMVGSPERPGRRIGEAQWRVGVETLYPGQLAERLSPTHLAWLTPGAEWQCRAIDPAELSPALHSQQQEAFSQFHLLDRWQNAIAPLPSGLPLTGARHLTVPVPIDVQTGCRYLRDYLNP
ncbi:hypothetical protein [Ferrimonas balearica]|uniref:hypothetical protein n=1 Tax=Ferrimonas balearica TaxID=44012 RepID=UPI001C9A0675|nr:hypothetical protein [Ferrimonas balearica]MBY5923314.1 hypothetical protein [Ferrimonas balearica]MBY5995272.1 hypothetical protein [Ferrimonas balearica]